MKYLLILILVTGIPSFRAKAALFLNLTNYASGNAAHDGTIGTTFQVGSRDLLVTDLGTLDLRYPASPGVIGGPVRTLADTAPPDGLLRNHRAGLWSGSGLELASVIIPAGTTAEVEQQWRFAPLDFSVLLLAGEVYTIGVFVMGFDITMFNGGTPRSFEAAPDFTPIADVRLENAFGFPSEISYSAALVAPINGAANFRFTAIPEPSSVFFVTLGGLGLLHRRRQ